MKTLEELLASGTKAEITEAIKTRTKSFETLSTKSVTTAEELAEMVQIDEEVEKLTVKLAELKKIDDAKTRNAERAKAFNTPANNIPFNAGDGGDGSGDNGGRKSYESAYSSIGSLKHINLGDRQKSEKVAYDFFQFFCATGLKDRSPLRQKAIQYCEDNGIGLKTLNEGTNDNGGALVPPEFDPMLIRLIETYGVFRQFTRLKPMGSEVMTQPRRTGGVTAYWVAEAAAITASNPTFDNINLVAKKLAAITVLSSEISEDSAINIADELAFEIGYAFALAEDQAGFIGDGSSTYGGITGATTKLKALSATIAYIAGLFVGAGNNYSELLLTDFEGTVGLLPQYADPQAAWYCHKSFFHTVMQRLELAAGGVTAREISDGDRRGRPTFIGYPVNFTQVMPRIEANSQVCALFGDLAMASTMGDRRRRTLFTDPYSLAANDQIQVRGTERIDINVHDVGNASSSAGSRVAGPLVGLIMAAS